eukprot:256682-Rhodomonas_salina.3
MSGTDLAHVPYQIAELGQTLQRFREFVVSDKRVLVYPYPYTLSVTDLSYAAMRCPVLLATAYAVLGYAATSMCYAMPGTDIGYAATLSLRDTLVCCYALYGTDVGCYAMCGTEIGYAATRTKRYCLCGDRVRERTVREREKLSLIHI